MPQASPASARSTLVAPPSSAAAMDIATWAGLSEDIEGEWADGHLVEEELGDATHEAVVGWIYFVLRQFFGGRARVFGSDLKFAVSPRKGRKPDVSVFLPGSDAPPARGVLTSPPGIMVEVVSLSPGDVRRDRIEKLREYAAFGVQWYWLVDPESRTLEILELQPDGRYVVAVSAADGRVEEVPGCPGLTLDLADLWAEVDGLA